MSELLNESFKSLTEDITCPYCGYEHQDSWEIAEFCQDEEVACQVCQKNFYFQKVVITAYLTYKDPGSVSVGGGQSGFEPAF